MNKSKTQDEYRVRPVYVGAAQYEAGDLICLEEEIDDDAMRGRLRDANHGADTLRRWGGDVIELAEAAMRKCLLKSGRAPKEIDAVFLLSNGLDEKDNLDAIWLGSLSQRLGLSNAAHYQVGMVGCASFHWAARLAASLIGVGQCNHILIVTFDKVEGALQRLYGEATDLPYLTSDAAAACLFSSSSAALSYRLVGKVVNIWDGKQAVHASLDDEIRCIDQLFSETCASANMRADQIDLFITNNYSFDVSRLYCQIANLSYVKAFTQTIPSHAHCFGSDNIINLHYAHQAGLVVPGQRLMLFSAGPFQWGACLLEKFDPQQGPAC